MAAQEGAGSGCDGGAPSTGAMERVLPMLLVPVPAEARARLGPRARLHREQEALGSLTASGSLQLLSLAPGGRGESGCSLAGPFRHFIWENSQTSDPRTDRPKLLTLSDNNELCVHEFKMKDGKCDITTLCSCSGEMLKKLIEDKNIRTSSLSCLRILSFQNASSVLLINRYIVLHIAFPGRDAEVKTLSCFTLALPAQALERIADSQLCRGFLFVLDGSGWIYVFDAVDGTYLARVDLTLHQDQADMCGEERQQPADVSSFTTLKVSQELDVVVVISCSSATIAVDLNVYFRQHPEHILCERKLKNLPIRGLEGVDEDDPANSVYNVKLTRFSFQVDRSWKTQLSELYNSTTKPRLEVVNCVPWFQGLLHFDLSESGSHIALEEICTFIPQDLTRVQYSRPWKDHIRSDDLKKLWKVMPIEEQEEPVKLKCVSVTGFTVLFTWLVESTGWTVVLWDLETQNVHRVFLGKKCIPVDCSGNQQLCLVLTENGLSLILFGLTQEEFLNRLMIHGSASTVDTLCHLNAWGRCSIPIHALEAGLENRQLDTVDFFLKSKENLFNPSSTSSVPDQTTRLPSHLYLKSVKDLIPALDLLCSAIRENDSETQSKHFSEQLLKLTLSFLNKQIREIFAHTEELDEHLQNGVDILTNYIIELRTFMIKFPRKPADAVNAYVGEDVPRISESEIWRKLSPEQVISNAILNNKIPEAQSFFRITNHAAQNLGELIRIGLDLVFDRLLKNNIKEATELLKNMGFNVKDQLHKICFYTAEKNVRDFLVGILKEENHFSEEEKRIIDYVHQVEKLYSGPFKENTETQPLGSWRKEDDFSKHRSVLDFLKFSEKDEIFKQDHGIILSWAQWWDCPTRENILLPRRSTEEVKSCSPRVLWRHITAHHDWLSIFSWIEELQTQDGCVSFQQAKWPHLTVDIIDQNTCCNSYLRNEILDKLARNGIFLTSELEDFELLLLRLSRIGGVMQNPLPVQNYTSRDGLDFHACFLLYCLERSLQHLLYVYLDYYNLNPLNCPLLEKKELHETYPWFEFLVRCRQISSNLADPKLIFQASLANAQILIPSNQASVSSMLLEGHTLLALATTVYASGGLSQVVQKEEGETSLGKVDPQLLKMALTPYPKLRAALFPQYFIPSILPHDITLYHLIQSLSPFDPTRLFGWQATNTLAIADTSGDLPHFSSPDLVNKYAIVERLNFAYYLRHGRPSFAFGTFLVQELVKSKSPKQLIQQVGNEAYMLALSLFHMPSVGAACVCFLELLGIDSLKLRVDMKVANIILSYKCRNEETQYNCIRESLAEKLVKLANGRKASTEELLSLLEEGIWDSIQQQGISRTSSESGHQWSLVVQFCRLHNVRLSTAYLRECSRANDWLQFIVYSQLHSYPLEEVRSLLRYFSPVLQDHLQLAFENLPSFPNSKAHDRQACDRPLWEAQRRQEGTSTDLFQILLQCPEEPDSWRYLLTEAMRQRAPILSILASCFKDANIVPCLSVWIITSVDNRVAAEATSHIQGSVEDHEWDLEDLSLIWRMLVTRKKSRTLTRSFQLFLKDSTLLLMMEMYELCMLCKKYQEAKVKLLELQKNLETIETAGNTAPFTIPVPWLKCQVSLLWKLMLQQCETQYELRKLLQLFSKVDHLSDGPDVKKLCLLSQILKDTSTAINHSIITNYSTENFVQECKSIVERLQTKRQFALARKVAGLAELPVDSLVIEEITQEMQTLKHIGQWYLKQTRIEFWKKCHENFKKNSILKRIASDFFLAQATVPSESSADEKWCNIMERRLLLTLAGHWLAQEDPVPLGKLEELEKQIWLCCVTKQIHCSDHEVVESRLSRQISTSGDLSFDSLTAEFSFSKLAALNASKYLEIHGFPPREASESRLDKTEAESLNLLIGRLLDDGSVHEASRVCHYFQFYNQDVFLVLHCRALASGEASVDDLHPEIQAMLRNAEPPEEEEAGAPVRSFQSRRKQASSPAEEGLMFFQLTALCQDRTLVGMKLLDKISSVPPGELSCTTELLILAHQCFTLTCHMEGIIRVLQAARLLTDNHLAPNDEYGLVVRLLTGIGRYNEMTYIFDLLHRKHYFEVLMRKKLDPSGTLKTALLDYIKRCRPGDSEKHNMIALCFSMCREIGENHEAAARIQLKLIESQPWEECIKDGPQLKQLLLKALTLMLDAAESYAKDSCVRQALHCHQLTKLITLQIHFLNTGQNTMLINLNRQNLKDCIMALPRFYQASIVAEAYDFVPDWAEILYHQVILKGDFNYLEEFKHQRLLKTSIFEEISKKFKQHQPTETVKKNMKNLLSYCEDVYLHYKLAYEHKFYDVINKLLKEPQTGCCLNDMLAN
uniref:SPG11 vesicle trafficking associated, spatacsin n=1 Tax=Vombatus ursinus TaxID=29139 RepID=A0A4X2KCL8_VOMUR